MLSNLLDFIFSKDTSRNDQSEIYETFPDRNQEDLIINLEKIARHSRKRNMIKNKELSFWFVTIHVNMLFKNLLGKNLRSLSDERHVFFNYLETILHIMAQNNKNFEFDIDCLLKMFNIYTRKFHLSIREEKLQEWLISFVKEVKLLLPTLKRDISEEKNYMMWYILSQELKLMINRDGSLLRCYLDEAKKIVEMYRKLWITDENKSASEV